MARLTKGFATNATIGFVIRTHYSVDSLNVLMIHQSPHGSQSVIIHDFTFSETLEDYPCFYFIRSPHIYVASKMTQKFFRYKGIIRFK